MEIKTTMAIFLKDKEIFNRQKKIREIETSKDFDDDASFFHELMEKINKEAKR